MIGAVVDDMYQCIMYNQAFLLNLMDTAVDIDGRESTEMTIFAPLLPDEIVPAGEKSKVRNFAE